MPLLDHFHPPLSERTHWHAFHNAWATYLSSQLNPVLPAGSFAEANVRYGIEIDVAAFEEPDGGAEPLGWTPPAPGGSFAVELTEAVAEVGIFSRPGGPPLAGAVELVSPANKDRPAHREAFVSTGAAYLQAGVGLVLVDVVSARPADLHRGLLMRLGLADPGPGPSLSGSAYRCVERAGTTVLDVWQQPLGLGQALPTLPLWRRGGLCLPVELESTYQRTCTEQRVQPAA